MVNRCDELLPVICGATKMSKDLIDLHVSPTAIERAATALNTYISKSHAQQNEDELLGAREDFIWLVLSTKRMSPEKKVKPHRM